MFSAREAKCDLQRRLEAGGAQLVQEVVKLSLRVQGIALAAVAKGTPHRRALEAAVSAALRAAVPLGPELVAVHFLEPTDEEQRGLSVACVVTPPSGSSAMAICSALQNALANVRDLQMGLARQLALASAEVQRLTSAAEEAVMFAATELGQPEVVQATLPTVKLDRKHGVPAKAFKMYEDLRVLDDARGIPNIEDGAPQATGDEVRWAMKQTAESLKDPQLERLVTSVVRSLRRKSRSSCHEWACLVVPSVLQNIMFDNPVRRDIFVQAGSVHAQQQRLRAYVAEGTLCVALAVVASDALRNWTETLDNGDRAFLTDALGCIGELPELDIAQARGLFDRVIGRYVIIEALVLSSDRSLNYLGQVPQDVLSSVFRAPWLGLGREMSFLYLFPSITACHGYAAADRALDIIARSWSSSENLLGAAKAFLEDNAFAWPVRTDMLVCLMSVCRRAAATGCPCSDGLEILFLQVVLKAAAAATGVTADETLEGEAGTADPLADALQAILLLSSGDHLWKWAVASPTKDPTDLVGAKRFLFTAGAVRIAHILREASRRFGNLWYNEDRARTLIDGSSLWVHSASHGTSFTEQLTNTSSRQNEDFGQLLRMYLRFELALGAGSMWRFLLGLEDESESIATNLSNLAPEGSVLRLAIAEDFRRALSGECSLSAGELSVLLGYLGFYNPSFQRFLRDGESLQKVEGFVSNVGFRGGILAILEAFAKLMGREEEPYIGDVIVQVIDIFGLNAVSWELFGRVVQAVQHGEERRFFHGGADGTERFGLDGLHLCAKELGKAGQVLQDKVARTSSEDLLDKVQRVLEPLLAGSPPSSWAASFQTLDTVIFTLEYTGKEDLSLAYTCFQEECQSSGHELVVDLLRCARKIYVQPLAGSGAVLDPSASVRDTIMARTVAMEKRFLWHGIAFEPSDWQTVVEITAAAAEAMTAKYNVQMLPHHTQVITTLMFAIRACGAGALGAGFGNLPKTMLARLGTGEGKSLIIGMLAAFVARKGLRAHVVNDSRILTTRDFETNRTFFEMLGIRASARPADLKNKTIKIVYCTGADVEGSCLDCLVDGRSDDYEQALKETVLIVDEVDGLIFDKGATSERLFEDTELSTMVHDWMVEYHQHGRLQHDDEDFRTQDECSGVLQRELVAAFDEAAAKQEGQHYSQRGDLLYLIDQKTSKVQESGWALWLEVLKSQRTDGNYSVKYKYVKAIISRIQCFMSYSCIFGLTGSLGQSGEKSFLAEHYQAVTFRVPFFLDTCRSDSMGGFKKLVRNVSPSPHPFADAQEQQRAVVEMAVAHCADVPVLVLVRDAEAVQRVAAMLRTGLVEHFGEACDPQAGVLELLYNPKRPQEFVELVTAATEALHNGLDEHVGQAWRIAVTTAEGGRGHDYRITDPSVDQCGGLLLLLTWVPWSEREWVQFLGRTGRQDHKGQFAVLLDGTEAQVQAAGRDLKAGETVAQALLRHGDLEADAVLKGSADSIIKGRLMHRLTSRYWSLHMQNSTTKAQNWEWKRLCEDHHTMPVESIQKRFDESFPPKQAGRALVAARPLALDLVSIFAEVPALHSEPLTALPDLSPRNLQRYQEVEAAIELYWSSFVLPNLPRSQGLDHRECVWATRKAPRHRGDCEPEDSEVVSQAKEGGGRGGGGAPAPLDSKYWVREVHFFGGQRRLLIDEEGGASPLAAICNVLLLRCQITLPQEALFVTPAELLGRLNNLMLDLHAASLEAADERSQRIRRSLMACLEMLPSLTGKVDVDVHFSRPKDFGQQTKLLIFELLDIGLVHGWLVSEEDPAFVAVAPHYASSLRAVAAGEPAGEAKAAREFLERGDDELTLEGIIRLHEVVQDRELAVLFRTGRFVPILKRQDELLTLCSGADSEIIWRRLVDGDGLDDHFRFRPDMPL